MDLFCGGIPRNLPSDTVYLPAVVQIHILVALISESSRDESLNCSLDDGLVNVAVELVPGVPPKGRGEP